MCIVWWYLVVSGPYLMVSGGVWSMSGGVWSTSGDVNGYRLIWPDLMYIYTHICVDIFPKPITDALMLLMCCCWCADADTLMLLMHWYYWSNDAAVVDKMQICVWAHLKGISSEFRTVVQRLVILDITSIIVVLGFNIKTDILFRYHATTPLLDKGCL